MVGEKATLLPLGFLAKLSVFWREMNSLRSSNVLNLMAGTLCNSGRGSCKELMKNSDGLKVFSLIPFF